MRDKYEEEFRELENSEKQTKERYNQVKAQITEVQGNSPGSNIHRMGCKLMILFS